VISITAQRLNQRQNLGEEAFMPILMVALIALAAFGLIGVFLGAAVVLEQRKVTGKDQPGRAA